MQILRHLVRQVFNRMGASTEQEVRESIMIRGGLYCGRRFRCDGLEGVWFAEEKQVKFFDRDGSLAAVEEAHSWSADKEAA